MERKPETRAPQFRIKVELGICIHFYNTTFYILLDSVTRFPLGIHVLVYPMGCDCVSALGRDKLILETLVVNEMHYKVHKPFDPGDDLHFEVGAVPIDRNTVHIFGN
ncbi:hypothetical protein ATCV1_z060L [Acanthocystis turfacea chlorella virus 1]|uniref:Uncharacterized protein z060L n=1 Tax=Chlorovirus heliozoae TaxID=322019 RepID=A7K820_9PHYC|nr:hypothetical protein ATCV1_z060L [Acanthocystis turfacea chlorella virus 1]ABT16194.1 hypothetical protein ATCV1_z060L [Acanthocystis turfacea chlorella virus 1]